MEFQPFSDPGTSGFSQFAALPNRDRSVAPERVLVSFGRLDPQNLTGRIIEVPAPMPGWPHLTVVMSGQSEYSNKIARNLRQCRSVRPW